MMSKYVIKFLSLLCYKFSSNGVADDSIDSSELETIIWLAICHTKGCLNKLTWM